MFTNFDIVNLKYDSDTIERLSKYDYYRKLYEGDFTNAFSSTILKIRKRYPLDNTTAQSLINVNLFWALTDFFKGFLTNQGININVDDAKAINNSFKHIENALKYQSSSLEILFQKQLVCG